MQFPHQSPDSSCLPLGARDLMLITKDESEIHCLLRISFPFGPKAEAASKNSRSTNHANPVPMAEINIYIVLCLLLLCSEHTHCAWPFIYIISSPQPVK